MNRQDRQLRETLQGARIVVTRPEGRGETLCERIAAAGGEPLFFPVIAIRPLNDIVVPAGVPDWLIFASVAAVDHGLRAVAPRMQNGTRVAAIGTGTAASLRAAGVNVDALPERQESEGLLSLPEFQDVRERHIWIVRGRGGRDLLADTLAQRGAHVAFVESYERTLPVTDTTPLLDAWRRHAVDAIVISSRAGLENLHALLDAEGRGFLRQSQLVMPTARMLKLALELDVRPAPLVADGASDDAIMTALSRWWRERRQDSR